MKNRVNSLPLKLLFLVIICAPGTTAHADTVSSVSPALEPYPAELLKSIRGCTGDAEFLRGTSNAADQLEAWFMEFRRPAIQRVLSEVRASAEKQSIGTIQKAYSLVDGVRWLVDFRTEQALISMVDAKVRRNGSNQACKGTVSQLLLSIAAQRDRAWTWAEVVDGQLRLLKIRDGSLKTGFHSTRVAESLRKVERSYEQFDQFKK